ncbi:MAG: glycosyltransferase family 2 protein [Deltaproteobacteria bacterium]|nr:glycosyltransferase family 2 protein [Deltaproteobacteria bacterium]MCL5276184.1 glycosyltransferase family 2 protein [Deltaproteobacteria bacterium]
MIDHPFLQKHRFDISTKNDSLAGERIKWIKANPYYYNQLIKSLKFIIEENSKVLHIRCSVGYLLNALNPKKGVGIDDTSLQIEEAKKSYPHLTFINQNPEALEIDEKFDYILITNIEDIVDIKALFDSIRKCSYKHTRIIIVNYNYLWNPAVRMAERLKLKVPQKLHNWLSIDDIKNFLKLSNFEFINTKQIILFPFYFPMLSYLLNKFVSRLPLFKHLAFIRINIARPVFTDNKDYSVSIIIPCKNEVGNIEDAVKRMPPLGTHTEIIFADDKSTDGTPEKVLEMMKHYPQKDVKLVFGPGICKSKNVWTGFNTAKGDILMILDADLSVLPEELPYFYEAIKNEHGEFINGSRLVYPMHENAMKFFNYLGNKFFSVFFSYIIDAPIKDTLCGTKVLWRRDYERLKNYIGSWGMVDRWGDYDLLLGAAKINLKIVDLPVHYYERIYGVTKMKNVLKNGLTMLRISIIAMFKLKFY